MQVVDHPSLCFRADVTALASVRDFACAEAVALDPEADVDLVALVVGELAANAAVHQTGEALLMLERCPDGSIEISVIDPDPTHPGLVQSGAWSTDGHRGIQLVAALAQSWGVEALETGKRVWARLAPLPA